MFNRLIPKLFKYSSVGFKQNSGSDSSMLGHFTINSRESSSEADKLTVKNSKTGSTVMGSKAGVNMCGERKAIRWKCDSEKPLDLKKLMVERI